MPTITPFEKRHRDGSLWVRGQLADGLPAGYWERFRKDGRGCARGTSSAANRSANGRPATAPERPKR